MGLSNCMTLVWARSSTHHVELIVTNYTRLSEESQYRDDLLIRANYFSLAVIAVLIGTLLQASPVVRPLVAMAGVAIAYSFWLATESYKGRETY